ncbi:hypothetical protein DHX103_00490 [Planococcus sp. X10-3]|uniref:hypothetical protein n=1 Tax=Planococcus sp. X10-3 TaxID=3061240 RepID=UPI003BB10CB5
MAFVANRKKIFFSLLVIIVLSLAMNHQYQVTRAGSLSGTAEGKEWLIDYSLQKESRGEWLIDFTFLAASSDQQEIQESRVVFSNPVSHDVLTQAHGSNENYRFEGHVLSNTKKLSEKEIGEVLNRSYVVVKWLDEAGKPVEEKIFFKEQ